MNKLIFFLKIKWNFNNITPQLIIYTLQLTPHSGSTKAQNTDSQVSGTPKSSISLHDKRTFG